MSLFIDLSELKNTKYDNNQVNILKLNNEFIWGKTFEATFIVDGEIYHIEPTETGYISLPTNPQDKDKFAFIGWTIDGENIVDVESYRMEEDTTFYAMYIQANIIVKIGNTITNYLTFEEAYSVANSSNIPSTIKLYEDASSSRTHTNYEDITIDLNNHNLDAYKFQTYGGELIISDSSINAGGTLNIGSMYVQTPSILYLNSGNVNIKYSDGIEITSGVFIMNGGNLHFESTVAWGVYLNNEATYSTKFTMNGGVITSNSYAIYAKGYSNSYRATVTINGGTIKDCTREVAIRLYDYCNANISNCIIENNATAILCKGNSVSYKNNLSLKGTIIRNNNCNNNNRNGAGLYLSDYVVADLDDCVIENNTALGMGGAIYTRTTYNKITIKNSIIRNNTAQSSSAIDMYGGTLTLDGVTITGNVCTTTNAKYQCAIYTDGGDSIANNYSNVILKNNTIINNNTSNGLQRNLCVVQDHGVVKVAKDFVGTVSFRHTSGTGKVAQTETNDYSIPTNATYLSDEGYNVVVDTYNINLT